MNQENLQDTGGRGQDEKEQPNEFGWEFHRGPLLAAIVLTTVFYIAIFIYVAVG